MTVANNTFPDVTADAILAEDRTNLMPVARAKSNKPADADRVNRDRLNYDRVIEASAGMLWWRVIPATTESLSSPSQRLASTAGHRARRGGRGVRM